MQVRTGKPVYRFQFDRRVPIREGLKSTGLESLGAAHAAELEYVFKMLTAKKADWQPEDHKIAETMNEYWANFIRTGDPNSLALPNWPDFGKTRHVMHIDIESRTLPEAHRDRYEFLDSVQMSSTSKLRKDEQ
jgi:para-nitrobenzyl esterase